jgi:energy-coupling factor transporter ATP-binding protein EcfA2
MSLIELKNVTFKYHGTQKPALENINITIHKNDCVLVCGYDDAGKSTLGMIIKGLIPQVNLGTLNGEILYNHQPLSSLTIKEQVIKIGYLFTQPTSQLSMLRETVMDEIAFSCENLNFNREETLFRVKAMARLCEVSPFLHSTLESCSLGMLQRVALASVLVLDPDVVIFDEPLVHLDHLGQEAFIKLCIDLKKQGKTIIILDHQIAPYYELVDQVLRLEVGRQVYFGNLNLMNIPNQFQEGNLIHQLVSDVMETDKTVYSIEDALSLLSRRINQ